MRRYGGLAGALRTAWVVVLAGSSTTCLQVDSQSCGERICARGYQCIRNTCIPATCGDGHLDRDKGEECDGADLGGATCPALQLHESADPLVCLDDCTFDRTRCDGYCGDQQRNGAEVCDGSPPIGHCVGLDRGYDMGAAGCASCAPTVDRCGRMGWTPTLDRGVARLWGDGQRYVVAAGAQRAYLYDGTDWTEMAGVESVIAVWGTDGRDPDGPAIWLGTFAGGLVRWDGGPRVEASYQVQSLWGSSRRDVYAVDSDPPLAGLVHFDGVSWSTINDLPARRGRLRAVWSSPEEVYVVGEKGTILHRRRGVWKTEGHSETGATLLKVWGTGQGDVYALSGREILHSEGDGIWRPRSPSRHPDEEFIDLSGSARNDVVVVTRCNQPALPSENDPDGCSHNMWRYDGFRWTRLRSSFTDVVSTVWVDGPKRVWAASPRGVELFQGVDYVPLSRNEPIFTAVWAASLHDYFGVTTAEGIVGTVAGVPRTWLLDQNEPSDVTGFAVDDVYVSTEAGLQHYDGTDWISVGGPWLDAIWTARGSHDVYGCRGDAIGRYDGQVWIDVPRLPEGAFCRRGWSSGPDDIYVVGRGGAFRWDGERWSKLGIGGELPGAVWGWGPSDVYLSAERQIFHFDGSGWSVRASLPSTYEHVAAIAADDVFLVSTEGEVAHYDGADWAPMKNGPRSVVGVSGTPSRIFFAHGGLTALVRFARWDCRSQEICDNAVDDDCDGRIDDIDEGCR